MEVKPSEGDHKEEKLEDAKKEEKPIVERNEDTDLKIESPVEQAESVKDTSLEEDNSPMVREESRVKTSSV